MLFPSIIHSNPLAKREDYDPYDLAFSLFPDFNREFDSISDKLYGKHADRLMKADVHEHDDHYELDVDLPGFSKEEINISLQNGVLIISASKSLDNNKEEKGKLIRQERYSGSVQRSFYVGDNISEEDVKAKMDSGVLHITVAKKEEAKPEEKKIAIE